MKYIYNINKPVTTIQISNIINDSKGQEAVRLYNEFYKYMDFNISKDIERIEREQIEYILDIFIDMKSNIQEKNMTNYDKILFSKINKVNESTLEKYIEKNKNFFDRISKYQYDIGFEYEYYQSKLDWYTITPERINNFVKGLVNMSGKIRGIMEWTEEQLGKVEYRDTVKSEVENDERYSIHVLRS